MDLNQRKLIKSEWDSIEVPFSKGEIEILNLMINGFHDVNIKINNNESLLTFLKIEYNQKMEDYIYNKYLREDVEKLIELYKQNSGESDINRLKINVSSDIQIKSADKIRLEKNNTENLKNSNIYEYVLLENINKILIAKKKTMTSVLH